MSKIAILGASGFVGSTLAEELLAEGIPVKCLIHSAGNAWRLARHAIELQLVDLMDRDSIRDAISDCTHVVNCARGKSDVLITGMKNLLDACRDTRPERFVHISSVAVYGEKFAAPMISEDWPTKPETGSYGWNKLKQDEMVQQAAGTGLNAVVLCPPNISGPHSMFWDEICQSLRTGAFAFVENGRFPCALVDVANLVQGIRLALQSNISDGRRVFICDDPPALWSEVITDLADVLGIETAIESFSVEEATSLVNSKNPPRGSVKKMMGHLASSDVRASLRKDPYLGGMEKFAANWAKRLPMGIQDRLRGDDRKSIRPVTTKRKNLSVRLLGQQLRNVIYDCSLAKKSLGYQPQTNRTLGRERYEEFARLHWGLGSSPYRLLSHLGS